MAPEAASDADLPGNAEHEDRTTGRLARLRSSGAQTLSRYATQYKQLSRRFPMLEVPIEMAVLYVGRQGMLLASAVAFRTFLWLLPLTLVAAGILAGAGAASPGAAEDAMRATGVTGTVRAQITAALLDSSRSWWVAVLVGLVLTLWTTRTLMRNLTIANAHIWDAPVPKLSQGEVLRATLVFGAAWVAMFTGASIVSALDALFTGGIVLSFLCQSAITATGWLMITLHLPDRRRSWVDLLPGAVLFGVGLAVLHAVSRFYLPARIEQSSSLYGSLGVAGAVLVWLLVIGQLVVGCAILNRVVLRHSDPTFDATFDPAVDTAVEPVVDPAVDTEHVESRDSRA